MRSASVCIVGGGPAGTATAILARREGKRVVLIADRARRKPPIETLSAHAVALLGELGLADVLSASGATRSSGVVDAFTSSVGVPRRAILAPWSCPWLVDRERFDAALVSECVNAGVEVWAARATHGERQSTDYVIHAEGRSAIADVVVDATGSRAFFVRHFGGTTTVVDRQLAIFGDVTDGEDSDALVVESTPTGWLYASPRSSGGRQVVLVTDRFALEGRPGSALQKTLRAARLIRSLGPSRVSTTPIVSQRASGLPSGLYVVGDAAWTPDPLSGEGVARALDSARKLVAHWCGSPGPTWTDDHDAHLEERARWHRSTPFGTAPYYERRAHARPHAEVAHGDSLEVV